MRKITLASGQWGDLPLRELCGIVKNAGLDGIELAVGKNHFDLDRAYTDAAYRQELLDTLGEFGLESYAVGGAVIGQCVGDCYDPRLDNFAPEKYAGKPEEIRKWAIEEMMKMPEACAKCGIHIVTGFLGSPIWKMWYSFPQTTEQMVEDGFDTIVERWTPILDEFQKQNVKFAFEVHPTEIAFDYYSTQKLFKKLNYHPAFGLNFDPSHLLWQGMNPAVFLSDFAEHVFHVHLKDVGVNFDGRTGILGSHLPFGSTKRAWNFRSLGHGNVNFEEIMRVLNEIKYMGPLSIEWEDNGMERIYGLNEAAQFARKLDFEPSTIDFDAAIKTD